MPKFSMERSIEINVSQEQAWEYIVSFEKQALWSPWIIIEPTCKRKITGKDGEVWAVDEWDGEVIGAGERVNVDMIDFDYLDQKLYFSRPFKSEARSYFSLQRIGDNSCSVTWGMEGSLPFFMFFMKEKMKGFIKNDYDRGLVMLKELCETGKLETKVENLGEKEFPEAYFIAYDHSTFKDSMPEMMANDFEKMMKFLNEKSIKIVSSRSYYSKVDFITDVFTFRSAVEISKEDYEALKELPDGCVKWHYPVGKSQSAMHHGAYKFLGNTWSAAFMYIQAAKKKVDSNIPPFEVYISDPRSTEENELQTQIFVPVK